MQREEQGRATGRREMGRGEGGQGGGGWMGREGRGVRQGEEEVVAGGDFSPPPPTLSFSLHFVESFHLLHRCFFFLLLLLLGLLLLLPFLLLRWRRKSFLCETLNYSFYGGHSEKFDFAFIYLVMYFLLFYVTVCTSVYMYI